MEIFCESRVLQAARPGLLVVNNVIVLKNKITRQLPRRHPTLLTDYLKAVASKGERKTKRKVHQPILFFEEEKKSLHYKQLIYKDAATDHTLYIALCISVDTWMEKR